MFKRYLSAGAMLVLLAAVLIFTAFAQEGEPVPQATIDAAVATLIAQTEQPFTVTQTIQAALAQALTATAQTPTTQNLQPFDVSGLILGQATGLDLLAGPGRTAAYLAPDGEHFAYLEGSSRLVWMSS